MSFYGFLKTGLKTLDINIHSFISSLPDGITCNVLASDLEAGNFEAAHFEYKGGRFDIMYSGPVAEGYERAEYSDALRKLKWD